jgi:hypothetical protein
MEFVLPPPTLFLFLRYEYLDHKLGKLDISIVVGYGQGNQSLISYLYHNTQSGSKVEKLLASTSRLTYFPSYCAAAPV